MRATAPDCGRLGATPVAGINTGFGNFARVRIPDHQLVQLQENLIRSHAAGVGTPLSRPRTRMLLALRINVLAKGHSGISEKTLRQIIGVSGCGRGSRSNPP